MILQKPPKLVAGDTVALISPSTGLAGEKDILYRTNIGIKRLQKNFNLKTKVMSFYGPAILTDFAENIQMDSYTINNINKTLFSNKKIGSIETSNYIRKFGLMWEEKNKNIERPLIKNYDYEIINGKGIVYGNLIGGCMESLNNLRGTDLFPKVDFLKIKYYS